MKPPIDTNEMTQQAMAFLKSNRLLEARELFQKICSIDKKSVEALMMLGTINVELNALIEAASCMRRVIGLQPNSAQAHYTLGKVQWMQKKTQKALSSIERAVKINPDYAVAWGMLGSISQSLGKLKEAESHYRRAALLRPDLAQVHLDLADVLSELDKDKEAVSIYSNLAKALFDKGKPKEAIVAYKKALDLEYDNAILHSNLGDLYRSIGDLDAAEASLIYALRLNPNSSDAYNNMANVLKTQGSIAEAEAAFRRGLEINPDDHIMRSNLLFCLQSISGYSRAEILEEHIQWAKKHAASVEVSDTYSNKPDPDRRLRVAYVSPDLRTHAVGYLVEPILANHDPARFEVICYAGVSAPDNFTKRLRSMVHLWRNTCGMSDSQLAATIRSDGIDILLDLSGHTSKNRLTVFASKPAPVQVTYLGYSDTTGMSSIDYRLTDEISDPVGDEKYYTEKLFYLSDGFSCYAPPTGIPEVSKLPARDLKIVTFGCLSNLYKINSLVIDLWCRILHATPSSRLILFRHVLKGKARDRLYNEFAERGIDSKRVDMQCDLPVEYHQNFPHGTWHMGLFEKIDIMLDTFPRDSHVIACEALWMGVPFVTLYGNRHSGRICASLLTTIGLPQLIASTPDEYLEVATDLANNLDELESIRKGLRDSMKSSTLCDGKKFTGILEQAYREMWKTWCASNKTVLGINS